jgi:hypothetical protein
MQEYQEYNGKYNQARAERKLVAMRAALEKDEVEARIKSLEHDQLSDDVKKMEFEKKLAAEFEKLPKDVSPMPTEGKVMPVPQEGKK